MGEVFSMGAHLRRFIAEKDPQHAAVLLEQSLTAIERVKETMAKAPELMTATEAGKKGGRGKRGKESIPLSKGPTKDRLAARLKRDYPAIAARVANGEFKSIRAAALEAGIVKPMRSIPIDSPEAAIRALLRAWPCPPAAGSILVDPAGCPWAAGPIGPLPIPQL